jgi:uncharacterized protein YcaQ
MSHENLTLSEARRIALAAQGFDRPRPNGKVRASHIRGAIRRLGLVQIDYVNVLTPAHYQVLFSRLGPYDKSLFDDLVYRRREFIEQWAHERSILPVESWLLLRHRMETHRVRPWGFEKSLEQQSSYVTWALEEIRRRGPLRAEDLPEPDGMPSRMSDKWGWGMNFKNQVLEAHFGFGRLAVVERLPNFARVYDLAERVIPAEIHGRRVEHAEAQRELLRLAARSHGVGTAGDLADYFRMPIREARRHIDELIEARELHEARVEGWREPAYLYREARAGKKIEAAALLSPFDPLIWYRPRVARLFGFDYRIEIFTPQEKRRWGYYVLPFLLGERLVARVDLKADRAARRLLVLSAYLEVGADPGTVADALEGELSSMAAWLELDSVSIERRGDLARRLAAAVRARVD